MTVYRFIWWTFLDVLILLATIGILRVSLIGILLMALLEGVIRGLVYSQYRDSHDRPATRRQLVSLGGIAAAVTQLCGGLGWIFGRLGLPLTFLVIIISPVVARRILTKLGVPEHVSFSDPRHHDDRRPPKDQQHPHKHATHSLKRHSQLPSPRPRPTDHFATRQRR